MISFQRLRSFFLTMSLSVMLATAIAFGFGSAHSWAATSFTQLISPPQTQIATMNRVEAFAKNVEGKIQEATGNMSVESKTKSATKAGQFQAKTIEGMNNSIENPNYQHGGKTTKAEKQARAVTEEIKSEAREAFN